VYDAFTPSATGVTPTGVTSTPQTQQGGVGTYCCCVLCVVSWSVYVIRCRCVGGVCCGYVCINVGVSVIVYIMLFYMQLLCVIY